MTTERRKSDRRMNRQDDFEIQTTATVGEAFDVMVEASGIVRKNADYLARVVRTWYVKAMRPLFFIIIGLIVIVVALEIQIIARDETVETLQKTAVESRDASRNAKIASDDARIASNEAKVAAEAAKAALDAAIANSQQQGDDSNQAIKRINDIYNTCVVQKEC